MNEQARLILAATRAALRSSGEKHYLVGAAAVRNDGTLVWSGNGPAPGPSPSVHAEARLARKLDYYASVFVLRLRRDGTFGCAKPCPRCIEALRARAVLKVWYTTGAVGEINCLTP